MVHADVMADRIDVRQVQVRVRRVLGAFDVRDDLIDRVIDRLISLPGVWARE
jgi:hypothetical protein